jgi:glycosidase
MALKPWDVKEMKSIISRWQRCMIEHDGWNSVFIENHDNPRSVTRYTDDSDEMRDKGAKLLALMQTTLGGTIFVYQGEEIGIRNVPTSWDISEEYKDIETLNYWKKCQELYKDDAELLAYGKKIIQMKARDHSRTPMQWDASSKNAGFCKADVKPWMRVMDDFETVNAESQMNDKSAELSTWQFWQRRLEDRKEHADVFVYGDYHELSPEDPSIFAYVRTSEAGEKWLAVLNFSGKAVDWTMPSSTRVDFWACCNYGKDRPDKPQEGSLRLKPWEGLLGKCR